MAFCGILSSACAQPVGPPERELAFSGQKALEHVSQMVALGPRPAGSAQGKACGDYIIGKLKALGLQVTEDSFQADTPLGPRSMRNVIAEIPGKRRDFIILAGHYDTKLYKDFKFVGANDGGSSAAVLLELARVMAHQKGEFTRWITFFDGEEAFIEWTDEDSLYGSRHLVSNLDNSGRLSLLRAMVLVDMIGGKTLRLKREGYSTPWLVDIVWKKAAEMGHSDIFISDTFEAFDDHYPFIRVGIPAVDLLDLTYPYWHRPDDTIDKLSPRSMEVVGRVLLASLPLIESRLLSSPK